LRFFAEFTLSVAEGLRMTPGFSGAGLPNPAPAPCPKRMLDPLSGHKMSFSGGESPSFDVTLAPEDLRVFKITR